MRLKGLPVFLVFVFALGALMLLPALVATLERDWRTGRLFFYSAFFVMLAASALAAAAWRRDVSEIHARAELLTLLGVFAGAPVFAGIPFLLVMPELGWTGAYFEAVSCLTTTGATVIQADLASDAVHLWRAMLGWVGGLVTLTAAMAILAPRQLVDLPGASAVTPSDDRVGRLFALGPGGKRTLRALGTILPVYAALTAACAVALAATGGDAFVALCHAMGVVSTSGITPLAPSELGQGGRWAEAAAVLFLILSATRLTYGSAGAQAGPGAVRSWRQGRHDPEIQLLVIAVGVSTLWLFLHGVWAGGGLSLLVDDPRLALRAVWGGFATSVGMVTTSGYVSADWAAAASWTHVEAPALMLMGLATLGGGVATTAGGVKLFRAYALYRHGGGELSRLPHPNVMDTARTQGGRLSRQAIVNAWVYVMIYMAALAIALLALSLTGLGFDASMAGAVSSLSNAGPLFPVATGLGYSGLPAAAQGVMVAAMVLGRMEVLAVVALCNPAYWRA